MQSESAHIGMKFGLAVLLTFGQHIIPVLAESWSFGQNIIVGAP